MYKIKRYFQGVWKQAKMVRWPNKKDLGSAVCVVLIVISFAAICLLVSDLLISHLITSLDTAFPNGTEETTSEAVMTVINHFKL